MMMLTHWDNVGNLANAAQLTGLDAVRLIAMIVKTASNAKMHKRNCRLFAQHLKLIGNLLEKLKITELKKYPETREPLEQLEEALRRAYLLVDSCQNRSYLYLLAMGWNIVYQFRQAQAEIDRYLKIIPLISLVDNHRVKERLHAIEKDEREYTLDEEEEKIHDAILNSESSVLKPSMLKKSLSRRYPNLGFEEALQKENEKLQLELHRSRANMDLDECGVIKHLIEVTERVGSVTQEREQAQNHDKEEGIPAHAERQDSPDSKHDISTQTVSFTYGEWQADLFSCCMEPSLCFTTFIYPCGTFSNIAAIASNGRTSPEEACNNLMTYSLVLGCCCYTCCVRTELRRLLKIRGGRCDDFLTHLSCFCCALVQEWREIKYRGLDDSYQMGMNPPPSQEMQR